MNLPSFNTEPTTIPNPTTKPDVTPDVKPGNPDKDNNPWNVPDPSVNPTPKA